MSKRAKNAPTTWIYLVQKLADLWGRRVGRRAGFGVDLVIGTLNIEYQTTALSLSSVHLSPDHQITEVTNPRRLETLFRSPQLDLWQVSDSEWLLALRRPEPGPRKKRSKVVALAEQRVLPEFSATG